jgi:hypothetical protein
MTGEARGRIEKGFHQELRGSQGDLSCAEDKKRLFGNPRSPFCLNHFSKTKKLCLPKKYHKGRINKYKRTISGCVGNAVFVV